MDINANVNTAQCIVKKTHLGYDTFVNACTGMQTNVDWSGFDWLRMIAGSGLLLIVVATIILLFCVIFGVFDR